jgi:hypothetical protein
MERSGQRVACLWLPCRKQPSFFRYGAGHCRVAKNLVDSVGYGSVSWRVARRTIRPQNGLRDAGLVS